MAQAATTQNESVNGLSESAQENLDTLTSFFEREDADVSSVQLSIERVSSFFGSPAYFGFAIAFIGVWIVANGVCASLGWKHVDAPPFFWLQGIVSANALLLTIAVLIRQNRMSLQAGHRAHLDLQVNLLTEQKVTKILQVLQQQHSKSSLHSGALDSEGTDLAKPADPAAMLSAIKTRGGDQ
jgi:uncharacterized membrane protein